MKIFDAIVNFFRGLFKKSEPAEEIGVVVPVPSRPTSDWNKDGLVNNSEENNGNDGNPNVNPNPNPNGGGTPLSSSEGDYNNDKYVTIPDSYYENDKGFEEFIVEDSVTAIGKKAFKFCKCLEKVTIGEMVENIGDQAFYGCTTLRVIVLKSEHTVPKLGEAVFKCRTNRKLQVIPSIEEIRTNYMIGEKIKADPTWSDYKHLIRIIY